VGTRCADHVTHLYPQKLALTSPTGGGRSVGIVCSRTKATEFYSYTYSVLRTNYFQIYQTQMQHYLSRLFAEKQVKLPSCHPCRDHYQRFQKKKFNYKLLQ